MATHKLELVLGSLYGGEGRTGAREPVGPYHRQPAAHFYPASPSSEARADRFEEISLRMPAADWIAQGRPVRITLEVEEEEN